MIVQTVSPTAWFLWGAFMIVFVSYALSQIYLNRRRRRRKRLDRLQDREGRR